MAIHHPRRRGFTLAELFVVIVIVAILAAILYPVFLRSRPHPGPRCLPKLKQLATAIAMYLQDYDERFPPHAYPVGSRSVTLPALLDPYIRNGLVWQCPLADQKGSRTSEYDGSPDDTRVSYGYNWGALTRQGVGVRLREVHQQAATLLFVETDSYLAAPPGLIPVLGGSPPVYRHHGTANTAWVDGHVTAKRPEKLEAVANTEGGKPTRDGIDRYLYWNLR